MSAADTNFIDALRKKGYDIRKKNDENKYATYYMKFSFTDNDRI